MSPAAGQKGSHASPVLLLTAALIFVMGACATTSTRITDSWANPEVKAPLAFEKVFVLLVSKNHDMRVQVEGHSRLPPAEGADGHSREHVHPRRGIEGPGEAQGATGSDPRGRCHRHALPGDHRTDPVRQHLSGLLGRLSQLLGILQLCLAHGLGIPGTM